MVTGWRQGLRGLLSFGALVMVAACGSERSGTGLDRRGGGAGDDGASGAAGASAGAAGSAALGGSGGALGGGAGDAAAGASAGSAGEVAAGGAGGGGAAGAGASGGTAGSAGASGGVAGSAGAGAGAGGTGGDCARTVLVMVDTSQSMDEQAESLQQSKWELLAATLDELLNRLPETVALGMMAYPNLPSSGVDPETCFEPTGSVPIAPLDATQKDRARSFLLAALPSGSAATHDAYRHALETLEGDPRPGGKLVVLTTDGAPTYGLGCVGSGNSSDPVDPQPIVEEARAAHDDGLSTLAVGWFEPEDDSGWLSALAESGGTAPPGCVTPECHAPVDVLGPAGVIDRIVAAACGP